tara:strand:+ start:420 stop:1052 length:633 start_codon:yes stop_codon:yes gene_type:complete
MSAYTSSKQFELGSTAFRQWKADHSHCRFIHGYQLKTELTFGCNTLDDKNWCVDFGGLDTLKQTLRNHFDHTVLVAGDDPELATFQDLDSKGIIQLRIMHEGVGVEKFAEFVFKTADTFVEEATEGRCFVLTAKVTEHEDNYASYSRPGGQETTAVNDSPDTTGEVQEETIVATPEPPEEAPEPPRSARVGPNVTQGNFSDPFKGTTWGN